MSEFNGVFGRFTNAIISLNLTKICQKSVFNECFDFNVSIFVAF